MFSNILTAQLQFSVGFSLLSFKIITQNLFSPAAVSLISRLLVRDPALRLGAGIGDAADIKAHPFFEGLDWDALERKEIPPPWKPVLSSEIDTAYFNKKYTHADIDEATPPVRIVRKGGRGDL